MRKCEYVIIMMIIITDTSTTPILKNSRRLTTMYRIHAKVNPKKHSHTHACMDAASDFADLNVEDLEYVCVCLSVCVSVPPRK